MPRNTVLAGAHEDSREMSMRRIVQILIVVVCMAPSTSWAQAVMTGHVRDAAGAGVAGALVQATSPALIERARTTVSDASGRYRIEGLRPGTYVVSFTRSGFKTLQVESVGLSGSRTVVVDAGLVAGSQETVTVVHDGPVVDVRSATRQMTIDDSIITAVPNTRNYNSLLVVVPGVTTDRDDVVIDPLMTTFPIHGGRIFEGRLLVDGMSVGSASHGGQPAHYIADVGHSEEVVFTTSGGLGEVETGGPVMSIVPKQGGNSVSGSVFFSGNNAGMQGDNITDEIRNLGIGLGSLADTKAWDLAAAVGGPLARDRVWYFISGRRQSLTRQIPRLYYNQNAGNPASWLYAPDLTRQVYSDRTWENVGVRVTLLATQKHRFSVFHNEQAICRACSGATSSTGFPDTTVSPEAQGVGDYQPQRFTQGSWTAPATDRLLFDAGYARSEYGWGNGERDGNDRSLVRVTGTGIFTASGITYRSQDWSENRTSTHTWRASVSRWAGAHSFKAGYQGLFASDDRTFQSNDQNVTYRLSNGIPNQITQVISPFTVLARVAQASAYVQDQWTRGSLTLQGAVRYDRVRSWSPEQRNGPTRFLPAGLVFPETPGVDAYQDVTPRLGVAYDVSGNGRTAVKISAGKYLEGAGTNGIYYDTNPATRLVRTATRTWQDFNLNYIPNCVLENPQSNGECVQTNNTLFGQVVPGGFDSDLLNGMNVRPSDWSFGASVERQVLPRASLEVGYYRRWFDGFTVVDNVLVGDADFQQVNVTAPQNPNLPNGGGQVIGPLYIQNPASFTRFQQVTTATEKYGNQSQRSDSLDLVLNGRTMFGLTLQGGSSTRWTVSDSCDIRAAVPESAPLNPYCHVSTGARTQLRGLAAYTIPTADVQVGAVYQNKPGPPLIANATLFTGGVGGFTVVNVIEPGTAYGERISQLDIRAAKVLRFGRMRAVVGIDLYNALNSSDVLAYSTNYSSFTVMSRAVFPTSIIAPRLLRFSADVSF
jgi:hypothetical protein